MTGPVLQPLVIGVRLDQEGDTVPNGAKANFKVVTLDQDDKPRAAEGATAAMASPAASKTATTSMPSTMTPGMP